VSTQKVTMETPRRCRLAFLEEIGSRISVSPCGSSRRSASASPSPRHSPHPGPLPALYARRSTARISTARAPRGRVERGRTTTRDQRAPSPSPDWLSSASSWTAHSDSEDQRPFPRGSTVTEAECPCPQETIFAIQRHGTLTFVSQAEQEEERRFRRKRACSDCYPRLGSMDEPDDILWRFAVDTAAERMLMEVAAEKAKRRAQVAAQKKPKHAGGDSEDTETGEEDTDDLASPSRASPTHMESTTRQEVMKGLYTPNMIHVTDDVDEKDRTTVMMRNLPNKYSRETILALLAEHSFVEAFDFFYLPIDFRSKSNMGYAFINFEHPEDAHAFKDHFDGFGNWVFNSFKQCEVSWSRPFQGLAAHIDRYRNSPMMHHSVPVEYKPCLFSRGVLISFPPPTKPLDAPKIRRSPKERPSMGERQGAQGVAL